METKICRKSIQNEIFRPVFLDGEHLPGGGCLVQKTNTAIIVKEDLCCVRHQLLKHNSANYVDKTFDNLYLTLTINIDGTCIFPDMKPPEFFFKLV